MKKYLCGLAALEYWKVPGLKGVIYREDETIRPDFVVYTKESCYRPFGCEIKTCSILEAEKYTKNGVCKLPLAFLQMATKLQFHQLVYLGLQICSRPQNNKALCTVKELKRCAERLYRHRGRRQALRAIQYLREGSRSVMESMLYLFLRLPNMYGGCGFKEMEFNKRIDLKQQGRVYYADLILPAKKLIIEYDSYKHHNSAKSFARDTLRAAELETAGYQVVQVKSQQLFEVKHFKVLARNIANRIGRKIRIRAKKFLFNYVALVDFLKKKGGEIRSRLEKVSLSEVPDFPGVKHVYKLYLQMWEKLHNQPIKFINESS